MVDIILMETKTCSKCNETKNLNEFYNHPDRKDGKNSICKICRKEYDKIRASSYKFKTLRNIRCRRKRGSLKYVNNSRYVNYKFNINFPYKKCIKCKEIKTISNFYEHIGNIDNNRNDCISCKEEGRLIRMSCPERKDRSNLVAKLYRDRNRESCRKRDKIRYYLEKNNDSKVSIKEIKKIKSQFHNKCFKCENLKNLSLDHHIPLIKGGKLSLGNITILCVNCNAKKQAKDPSLFYSKDELILLDLMLMEQQQE